MSLHHKSDTQRPMQYRYQQQDRTTKGDMNENIRQGSRDECAIDTADQSPWRQLTATV